MFYLIIQKENISEVLQKYIKLRKKRLVTISDIQQSDRAWS